jgi:protein SCO1/2
MMQTNSLKQSRNQSERPRRHRAVRGVAAFLALGGVLGLTGCAGSSASADNPAGVLISGEPDSEFAGSELVQPYPLPDVEFTDTDGGAFNPAVDAQSAVTLVFFGYTHCPDICNTTLADIAAALRRADDQVVDATQLLFISVDPERDTPQVVRDYLDQFDTDFEGLTGTPEQVAEAAESLGVALEGTVPVSGGYEVEHGTQVIGFDAVGAGGLVWTQGTTVGDLRDDITRLAEAA